jgi:membrane protein implicated in regulation of membrane protease activity
MTWADFYLVCFVVGFALSVLAVFSGGMRWHIPHLPHGHGPVGGGHAPVAGHDSGLHAGPGAKAAGARGSQVSPFNFVTFTAFLAWFGGIGYLLQRYESFWFVTGLLLAILGGLVGGGIVYFFLAKVLTSPDEAMDPADYEMVGVLGKTSLPIREGGTGEMIYSQVDTRRVCGARSEDGSAIEKGTEVVVTRYEKGIAYVRRWDEMAAEGDSSEQSEGTRT